MKLLTKTALLLILLHFNLFSQLKQLTFDDLFTKREFYGKGLSGVQWMPGGDKFTYLKYDPEKGLNSIYQHDIKSGGESVFLSGSDLILEEGGESFKIQNYKWSPDGKYILFTGVVPARTVKSGGTFYLYDVESKKAFVLAESEDEQVNAAVSPDGKKLGFVRGNNLYVIDIYTRQETQLTFDGSENILNGLFDWVYEEEFSIIMGWEWSPDSKSIAYWKLDQSNVPDAYIAKWDSLYMQPMKMKYPKPGAANSLVHIGVADITTAHTTWMDIGEETDIYIPRIKYTKDERFLAIQRLNRLQNKLELLIADTKTGKTETVITETSDAWVEVVDELSFLDNGKEFIWSSERDGFKHLYLYNINGKLISQVTKGKWEVKALIGVDENRKKVYFTSCERGTRYTDLYSVNYDASGMERITGEAGMHSINMAPGCSFYIDKFSTANTLTVTSLHNTSGEKIRDLVVPDMSFKSDYNFVPVEFFSFLTSDGVELNASIMKPADFDPSKKYPVLFSIYGGPGSDAVTDRWGGFDYIFNQYLTAKGYIIFSLENRGTGNRGTEFRNIVYKNLGKWEVNDMVEGAKYLISKGYADPERIGIWGWSYGGYTAAITIMNGAEYFKAAVAVAPVTDWQFYDNIYTERFMQTPALNPKGYEESSPITHADKLKGKLLLIHGTGDDNVHFQNSVKLAEKLIALNKDFDVMFYPEKDHGIYGGKTRQHLYKKFIDFLEINLKGVSRINM